MPRYVYASNTGRPSRKACRRAGIHSPGLQAGFGYLTSVSSPRFGPVNRASSPSGVGYPLNMKPGLKDGATDETNAASRPNIRTCLRRETGAAKRIAGAESVRCDRKTTGDESYGANVHVLVTPDGPGASADKGVHGLAVAVGAAAANRSIDIEQRAVGAASSEAGGDGIAIGPKHGTVVHGFLSSAHGSDGRPRADACTAAGEGHADK